jgi:hypothetical protein
MSDTVTTGHQPMEAGLVHPRGPVPDRRGHVRPGHDAVLSGPALGSATVDVDRRLMLFVQYQGPTTGGRPVYDGRFNMTARKPMAEENLER